MAAVAYSLSCASLGHRFVHRLARRFLVTFKPEKPGENPLAPAVQPGIDGIGIKHNDHDALGDGTRERAPGPGCLLCLGTGSCKHSYFGRPRAISVVMLERFVWAKYSYCG